MCAKCKFFFASFSLQTNETHPGCNTSPSSFHNHSGILFDTVFFLGIRPASQTCSPSSTLSLSKTFYNNFHIVTVQTILRSKFWVVCKQEKCWKTYVGNFWCFPTWIFFTWVAGYFLPELGIVVFFHSFCFGHMRWLPEASRSLEDPHSILGHVLRDTRKDKAVATEGSWKHQLIHWAFAEQSSYREPPEGK